MKFDACSLAVGTHRWIALGEDNGYVGHLRPLVKQGLGDTPSHMLQEGARTRHLPTHHLEDLRIIDRVGHIIAHHSLLHIHMQAYIDLIVVADATLLRHHTMISVEAQAAKANITIVQFHKHILMLEIQQRQLLSTAAGSAIGADEATFLVDQRLLSAHGAFLSCSLGAIDNIFLQGTFHTVLPCIDALVFEL